MKLEMSEQRVHPRMLCADLVPLEWTDPVGRTRRTMANLEDISLSGACLQIEQQITPGTKVRFTVTKGTLSGEVRYCTFREIGYFVGIQFDPGVRWTSRMFRPMHLLDPRSLAERTNERLDVH